MITYSNLPKFQEELHQGNLTCQDAVAHYLNQIESNTEINAFLEVFKESATQQARAVDEKIAAGKQGKLAGLVIGIKDNIAYKNHKLSAASKILEGFESVYNATVVERLLSEDAIIIGRLNCDEFAMGSSNENSAYGPVLNPVNPDYVPGGSSGGSVAAVKAGLCMAALGTDTGGSIRQPASFSDTVGFKPTYGRVSRYGLLAYASSFDQIGPITNNVEDAALIIDVISGKDDYDSTLLQQDHLNSFSKLKQQDIFSIGMIADYVQSEGIDPEIAERVSTIFNQLGEKGIQTGEVKFPLLEALVPTYHVLTTAEASSNLSRYDGVHYGYRDPEADDLESTYLLSRSNGFGTEVKRRIMLGTFVLSAGFYDAYYGRAQKVRRLIREKTDAMLEEFNVVMAPSTPTTAFKVGENTKDPIAMYLQDIFTVQANLAGNPAISLPLGQHSNGLPFGIQLIGRRNEDEQLLAVAHSMMAHFAE